MPSNSIAAIQCQRLGGVDQWVMLRGESLAKPPLILLHGGPGMPEMRFFRRFNAPFETAFTVVNWDQRGTGKSFDRTIARSSMTVEQFIADLDGLVDAVCKRLGKDKVAIFGHAWGSALGVLLRRSVSPEGLGMRGKRADWRLDGERGGVVRVRRRRSGTPKRLRRAEAAARHRPATSHGQRVVHGALSPPALRGPTGGQGPVEHGSHRSRPARIIDLPNIVRGLRFSLDAMWPEVSRLNLHGAAPALQMPVFYFLGRRDHWVPPETSVFEASGHEPFADEAAKFNAARVELARPVLAAELQPVSSPSPTIQRA